MNQNLTKYLLGIVMLFGSVCPSFGQAGITASPSRLYFKPGEKQEQIITVVNPSASKNLDVGISMNDWQYDSLGNNVVTAGGELDNSCAKYVKILPSNFFTLGPSESKTITVSVSGVPQEEGVPVHTAMLYLTQLNAGDGVNATGAAIKVTVRMGVKLYQTAVSNAKPDVEIVNMEPSLEGGVTKGVKLQFNNISNTWVNGTIQFDYLNKADGKKTIVEATEYYTLPGDKRTYISTLPEKLPKGKYTVTGILKYGESDDIKIAEIDLDY